MLINKGDQIKAYEYKAYWSKTPTNIEKTLLEQELFSFDDYTAKGTFYTRSVLFPEYPEAPDYNFYFNVYLTRPSDMKSYSKVRILEDATETEYFKMQPFDTSPSVDTNGWFVRAIISQEDMTWKCYLNIPPSDTHWRYVTDFKNAFASTDTMKTDIVMYQTQNDFVAGDKVVLWDTEFKTKIEASNDDGLSYDIAVNEGRYGGIPNSYVAPPTLYLLSSDDDFDLITEDENYLIGDYI